MEGAQVRVRLLGTFEVDVAGRVIDVGGPRQQAVLALLLVHHGSVVPVDRIVHDLWRGEPPPRATAALQAYVSNLRRLLEPERAPRSPARLLVSAAPGYAVRLPDDSVDAWRFEALLRAAGTTTDPGQSLSALQRALALWSGPALAAFAAEPWAEAEVARLTELRLLAHERLVEARLLAGAAAEAVLDAEALVRAAPLREEGWRLLAMAQYGCGRQGEALTTLRRARARLADELGIDPGAALIELEQDVLHQRLLLPRAHAVTGTVPSELQPDVAGPDVVAPFVGRTAELGALVGAADATRGGTPGVAVVVGEPGAGKSALLHRLRHELRERGWRVASGRCPESDGSPAAWAWVQVLRGLASDVDPGTFTAPLAALLSDDATAPRPEEALRARFRLHRAVTDWLATLGDRPLAIILDDVHRADTETRSLVRSLAERPFDGRALLVLAHRPEREPGLDELLADLAASRPARVALAGLDDSAAAELIAVTTGAEPDTETVSALTERTGGNPFYLVESARLLAGEGAVVAQSQVPAGVQDVLRRRFARLPDETVSVLRLAAVLGRDVDIELLIEAAEAGEDTVLDALESGVLAGLLTEPGHGQVRFSHVLVRDALYAGVPALRRARWHARVLAALERSGSADSAALAHHSVHCATPSTAGRAAEHCCRAAEHAEARYAYDAAAALYRQALECVGLAAGDSDGRRVQLLARLASALIRAGATEPALAVREDLIRLAQSCGEDVLVGAITSWNVPTPWTNRGYGTVDANLVEVIDRLLRTARLSDEQRCRLLCAFVRETSYSGDARTEPAAREAEALADRVGAPEVIALAMMAQAEVYLADVHPDERDRIRRRLRAVAEPNGMLAFTLLADILDAQSASVRLDLDELARRAESAHATARRYQLRQAQVVAGALHAMLAHLRGDLAGAEAGYERLHAEQRRAGAVDADGQWLLALLTVRLDQDRLGELIPVLQQAHDAGLAQVDDALALALATAGDISQARSLLADPAPIALDYLWLIFQAVRGLAAAATGATELCAEQYRVLLPYREQVAGAGTSGFVVSPVALVLGRLAVALGNAEQARQHFTEASAVATRCGSAVWQAQSAAELNRLG
jgi:DNA-binding SARP family transcriptional activator